MPGSDRPQRAAPDPRPHRSSVRLRIAHPLVFANDSLRWGGGVCFVDPDHTEDPPPTLALARLITVDQLTHLWAEENRGIGSAVDLERLAAVGHLDADRGWYRRLLYLGSRDGIPVATVTTADRPVPNPPTAAYESVVAAGLAEAWDLDDEEVERYLAARRPGLLP